MPTTKAKITEQCQRIYARFIDRENLEPIVYKEEITLLVEQALNESLKEMMPDQNVYGGVELPTSGLLSFTPDLSTALSTDGKELTLPVVPINLPYDMGIFKVYHKDDPTAPYIPITKEASMVFSGSSAFYLEGQVGYFRQGFDKIRFTADVKALATNPVVVLDDDLIVEMFIADFSQFSSTAVLPISADMERIVIRKTIESLSDGRIARNDPELLKQTD